MASGQLYDANYDPELIEQRSKCKALCQEFNTLPYDAGCEVDNVHEKEVWLSLHWSIL